MRLTHLYVFLFCEAYIKCCDFSELSGNILECEHNGNKVQNAQNGTIEAGSVCKVELPLGVYNVQCQDTHWIILQEVIEKKAHIRRKRGWWRKAGKVVGNVLEGIAKGVICVLSLFTACAFGDRHPSDRTPPTITCAPPKLFVTAEPFSYYTKATWTEPEAFDDTDGKITPRRISGYPPGHHFREGDTTVTYKATDTSGNSAYCDIIVIVKVVRCDSPKRINNGYFQCNPVTEHLNGGTCRFGCYDGFELVGGPDYIHCKDNGQWSDSHPICKPLKCPALQRLEGAGEPSCTDEFNFRSICSYNCGTGFDMPPKVSKTLVCDRTKSWRSFGTPKCIDVEPPTFKSGTCPSIVVAGTDPGLNSTIVSWKPPEVVDNSNNAVIESRPGYSPGVRLTTGIYSVWYGAQDAAGNIAFNNCSFKIIVREIRCSKLYPTPYLQINCPNGYGSGASCNISCDPGKVLVGLDHVRCKRNLTYLYGVWNWKESVQSTCIKGRTCADIPPPKNGAVVCDNWEGGEFCQVQCKNGTQMSSVSLNKLYVCQGQKGEWSSDPPKVKTCRAVRSHHRSQHIGIEVYYYFDGKCTDPKTKQQISNNFIERLKASLYQDEVCPDSIECNKGNVHITCGESSRTRRNADSKNILVITAKLPVTLLSNESLYTAEDRYINLLDGVQDVLDKNVKAIFGNATVSQKEFVTKGLQIECPKGSVKSEQSLDCIDCPEGTFYTRGSGSSICEVCRKEAFQNRAAQLSCIRCPLGTTTHSVGATSAHYCEGACLPGTYSSDGLMPCTPCEQGQYQVSYGQTFCRPCRGSKSTLTFGMTSASDCKEFDIELIDQDKSEIKITSLNNVSIKDFTLTFWFRNTASNNSSLDKFPTITLLNNKKEAVWLWEELKNAKQKKSESTVNFGLPDTRWHFITLYRSVKCMVSVSVDGMVLPVVDISGGCTDITFNSVSITADNKTSGSLSQLNIWRGRHQTGYKHRCFSSEIGDVFSWKTMEEAEITGAYMDIPSQCDDFDNCVSSPCLHGSCTDALHGFTCACDKGFSGMHCELNIDDCEADVCMNNATCIDGVSNYTCSCPSNFTGQFCEIEMVDGDWSEWGNWSECSTTCGDGERKRKRLCNSPSPDNGGEDCHGDTFDFITCNNTDCPVCPEIPSPVNGSLDCINDTETINCTISCDDGFDFDIEPLPLYHCGPHTFKEWNYQSNENPERRIPRCVEIKVPKEMTVIYLAHYEDLYCANQDLEDFAVEQIDLTVKTMLSNVACLVKNTCALNYIKIIDCESESNGRKRRAAEMTAGFSLQLQTNPTEENKNETMQDLEDAFKNIQNAADSGDLTVQVLGDYYELRSNSTEIQGDVKCGPGETKVKFYCVPCGKGSYLNTDICKPCPVGTYQTLEGQSYCVNCPPGKRTIGIQSISINECTVNVIVPQEDGFIVTGITAGYLCVLVVITVVILIYSRYRSSKAKILEVTDINMVSQAGTSSDQDNGEICPKNKHFEATSLTFQSNVPHMPTVDSKIEGRL